LLGNHFHFLVKILSEQEIKLKLKRFEELNPSKILAKKREIKIDKTVHEIVSHQLKKFFQSYAMAYNKQQNRVGTLFQKPFKRALINDEKYFTNMIYYIHNNPRKHGLISDFRNYEWSSYKRMMIEKPTKLRKKEVLEWFGNKEMYLRFHDRNDDISLPENWDLDD
jgi:putative transposase